MDGIEGSISLKNENNSTTPRGSDKITLISIDNDVFCFSCEDYFKLRFDHRIIGKLIGSNAALPSNQHLPGLPAIFNPYEVQLMLDKDLAIVVDRHGLLDPPSIDIRDDYLTFIERNKAEQKAENDKRRLRLLDDGLAARIAADRGLTVEEVIEAEKERLRHQSIVNPLIQMPTQHPFDVAFTVVRPPAPERTLASRVFRDLWERGFHLTRGEPFGADFLAYPGDPLYFHASHLVWVVEGGRLSAVRAIACGREAVVVNKFCVFAFEDERGEVGYQTMQWEGKTFLDKKVYKESPKDEDQNEGSTTP